MELQGKKINFLGDSITEGHGVAHYENIFHQRMLASCGLAAARNYGIGGTRIARQQKPTDPNWDRYFASRIDEMDPDADIVVVFGGTNDYGHGDAPIGTFADRTPDTFYGAMHDLILRLFEKYGDATLVFMTPTHRGNEYSPRGDGYKEPTLPLVGYVDIIKEVCRYYGIPVVDLYANVAIQPEVPILREKYIPDGLHPNDAGHKIIADRLTGFLKTL
ncbi:MAG: SGNH/GDSL hydrolase family protein [Eubacteriales bacterium]